MLNYKLYSLLLTTLLISCGDDASSDQAPPVIESRLVSATPTNEVSLQTLQTFANATGQTNFAQLVKYGVKTFTIVYQTTYNGKIINASGLLYLPQGLNAPAPLLSLQHGTTFEKEGAPSVTGDFTGMEYFASAGYISFMPDFIGYGESKDIFHPYYDKEHSANAVIDMIKSVKEFLTKEKIDFNDQLFLAGYSEGGYVTLAAAEEIEKNRAHRLTVTAVAAGAGGYDLTEMLKTVTGSSYYAYPSYLAFVILSYNNTYGWNKPLTYFFNDKYAQALSTYMNGQYSGGYINSKLTTDVKSLLSTKFFNSLTTTNGEAELKNALKENSVSGWKTNLPIQLYHGTKDEIIPYQNSEVTLQNFKNLGSTNVSLTLIPQGSHGSSFIPMLQKFVPWFQSFKQ